MALISALNYGQDFENRVKESLKRTTNSKWAKLTKSRIVLSNTFTPLFSTLNYVSSIGRDKQCRKKMKLGWGGLDRQLSTCLTTNYKKRINSRQSGIFTTSVTGLYDAICFLFKKHQLKVQFCYLRLYFGIDIVSRRLLQWVARIENGLKVTKKVTLK